VPLTYIGTDTAEIIRQKRVQRGRISSGDILKSQTEAHGGVAVITFMRPRPDRSEPSGVSALLIRCLSTLHVEIYRYGGPTQRHHIFSATYQGTGTAYIERTLKKWAEWKKLFLLQMHEKGRQIFHHRYDDFGRITMMDVELPSIVDSSNGQQEISSDCSGAFWCRLLALRADIRHSLLDSKWTSFLSANITQNKAGDQNKTAIHLATISRNLLHINTERHCSHNKKIRITENGFLCYPYQFRSCFLRYNTV
jgi:hypothetical protein